MVMVMRRRRCVVMRTWVCCERLCYCYKRVCHCYERVCHCGAPCIRLALALTLVQLVMWWDEFAQNFETSFVGFRERYRLLGP